MFDDTIIAPATGHGGAIAIVRLSGPESIAIADRMFHASPPLSEAEGHTMRYGKITDTSGEIIDEAIAGIFRSPSSYTGEDMVEISCHASSYIVERIIVRGLELGARTAEPGEFTLRAFKNGKMDLVQAEAVADLIASQNEAGRRLAINQLRGGYSKEFGQLRERLVHFMSLIELELDFGEEEVEFADRSELERLLIEIETKIMRLAASFRDGNAIKNGVPVAIVGAPNVGKSTLLNALLNEERAIVSDIAGTTRDTIEETKNIGGITFRFIDTAGIRHSGDELERIGIERTMERLRKAEVVLLVVDGGEGLEQAVTELALEPHQKLIVVRNKSDLGVSGGQHYPSTLINISGARGIELSAEESHYPFTLINISAKQGTGIAELESHLALLYSSATDEVVITNARHRELLESAAAGIARALDGLHNGTPNDFIAQDLREALHHLASLTGTITTDTILQNVFSSFCIGK